MLQLHNTLFLQISRWQRQHQMLFNLTPITGDEFFFALLLLSYFLIAIQQSRLPAQNVCFCVVTTYLPRQSSMSPLFGVSPLYRPLQLRGISSSAG
jgi:hypothetical protein